MSGAIHRTDSPSEGDDKFVVRYSGQYPGFYMARILPFVVIFAILALLYLDDECRRLIFGRNTSHFKPFSWVEFAFLLVLVTGGLADLALTLARVRRGAMALSISANGVTGPVYHRTRLLTWSEVADVTVDGRFLTVRRQPTSPFQKLAAAFALVNISLPAHHLDRDVQEILAATRRYAPAKPPSVRGHT